MHEKNYQCSHSTKSIGIIRTSISTQKIRRSHAPDTVCLQQNIGSNIVGPAYFQNTHTPAYTWHLTHRRSIAQDTTWDKHKKPLGWSQQQNDCFELAHNYLPSKKTQRPIISTGHDGFQVKEHCPVNTFASMWKKKKRPCMLQSASWWLAQNESSTTTSRLENHPPRKLRFEPLITTLLDKQSCTFTLITPPEKCTMFVEVDHSFIQTLWWTFRHPDMPSARCLYAMASAQPVKGVGGMA